MPWQSNDSKKQRALTYAVIIALIAGFFFLRVYFSLIVVAMIVAYLFTPVYDWLLLKTKRPGAASALTLLATIFALVIPLVLIIMITINQATTIINDISGWVNHNDIHGSLSGFLNWLNGFLTDLTGRTFAITQEQVWDQLAKYVSTFASFVLDTITSWVGSIGSIITSVILYMYVFTAVLVHRDKLISVFERLNPMGDEVSQLYLEKSGGMTKAMVRGQFIIAIIQGTVSALVLSLTGMPYFAFFALILSFMSVIPLGAGIITIPIGIVRILMGDVWQGVVIILNHLIVVTNIDNILKPILVPKAVKLQPALMLLAVFAGMAAFGFLGIFIGPVIMILIITTIDIYLRSTETPKNSQKKLKAKTP